MSCRTVLLCEGSHDRALLAAIAQRECGWHDPMPATMETLPEGMKLFVPAPPKTQKACNRYRDWVFRWPLQLTRAPNETLVIVSMGGDEIYRTGPGFVRQNTPDAVGVFLDMDGRSPQDLLKKFRRHYQSLLPPDTAIEPGVVLASEPRVGLWLVPDNESTGTAEGPILQALNAHTPELTQAATDFVCAREEMPDERTSASRGGQRTNPRFQKAIIGCVCQSFNGKHGASVASALGSHIDWLPSAVSAQEPFASIARFLEDLCREPA